MPLDQDSCQARTQLRIAFQLVTKSTGIPDHEWVYHRSRGCTCDIVATIQTARWGVYSKLIAVCQLGAGAALMVSSPSK